MTYGFKVMQEMISGLLQYLDEREMSLSDLVGRAVPKFVEWQHLSLTYVTRARISQEDCIKCGRCYAACEDTSHQAIAMKRGRVFEGSDADAWPAIFASTFARWETASPWKSCRRGAGPAQGPQSRAL